jgi:dienelactone hydrolase
MRERAKAGYDFLKSHALIDPEKMAAIGYCFGGTTVLEMARAGFNLKGVASFHGGLSTPVPAGPGDIKTKVIVFHGAEDSFISAEEVKNFQDEMKSAGADWQFVALLGAVHSFTVPEAGTDKSKGMAYHKEADERSWAALLQFFDEIFK